MKHLTFADKDLLVGDEAADLLLEYAAELAKRGDADTVRLHAFNGTGDEVIATFLLDAGAPLMAETSHSGMDEPDNAEAIEYMRARMKAMAAPAAAIADDTEDHFSTDEYELG
jgi:hypothetical protein